MKEVRLKRRHCRIPAVCQFGEKAELWRQRKIAGGQGRGAGGRLGGAQGTSGQCNCSVWRLDPEWTAPRVKPDARYGVWEIRPCQCRSISCNKWTTLVGMVSVGVALMVGGHGVCGKSLLSA